jgi:hypothetical protein
VPLTKEEFDEEFGTAYFPRKGQFVQRVKILKRQVKIRNN